VREGEDLGGWETRSAEYLLVSGLSVFNWRANDRISRTRTPSVRNGRYNTVHIVGSAIARRLPASPQFENWQIVPLPVVCSGLASQEEFERLVLL
jgi:hypothetical protein